MPWYDALSAMEPLERFEDFVEETFIKTYSIILYPDLMESITDRRVLNRL